MRNFYPNQKLPLKRHPNKLRQWVQGIEQYCGYWFRCTRVDAFWETFGMQYFCFSAGFGFGYEKTMILTIDA